jgi:2-polyprenyl-3-methyl-5-hydroxy-6-metoxy-1,4-benzoquinol methylase
MTETTLPGDALEARLQHSWRANAAAWSDAVREQRIASRRAGTDAAIVDAVRRTQAQRVLDAGCGEGWLARALAGDGRDVVGVDASPELIAAAQALGGARFEVAAYADLAARDDLGRFDAVVFNFALLGEDLRTPLQAARALLRSGGALIVQTVHPWPAAAGGAYADGWRTETFAGFGDGFREPMPWYFRTLGAWLRALSEEGFRVEACIEPVDAADGRLLSLLLHAVPVGAEERAR